MWPPHSPTRITKNSILKLAGAFHCPNTSRIRVWAFSYSIGEPCGRSNQLMTYFILFPFFERLRTGRPCTRFPAPCRSTDLSSAGGPPRGQCLGLATRRPIGDCLLGRCVHLFRRQQHDGIRRRLS